MKNIIHNYSGANMLELLEKYGKGSNGFYSDWWRREIFAKEKPLAGLYEINFEKKLTNLTREEQKKKIPKGYSFTHPAIILEAIFEHYKNTGERLLEDWFSRTNIPFSDILDVELVCIGGFDFSGVTVGSFRLDSSHNYLGVSFSRKIENKNLTICPHCHKEIKLTKI